MALAAVPLGLSFGGGVAELLLQTGLVGRMVLLILLFFSVVTWAIIIQKMLFLQKSQTQTRKFQKIFYSSNNLTNIYSHCRSFNHSQLARLYVVGYTTLRGLQRKRGEPDSPEAESRKEEKRISAREAEEIARALDIKSNQEMGVLEKYLIFLATAGSATPFIGLFGTVWGVMNAFRGLGMRGSASIEAVAPGISEALIATAAGLAVAIPAVIGYNYYINRAKVVGGEMDNFGAEFLSIVERNFVKDG
jgi:biopolymer transport protein TolQ